MANNLSNSGIVDGQVIFANQVNQIIDAFTGEEAYDIALSGSLTISGSTFISGSPGASGAGFSTLVINNTTGRIHVTGSYGGGGTVDTGSLMVTGSVSSNILTFTKGNGSTFNLTVNTGSAASINTGSFYISSSVSNATITFTQGDNTTEQVTVNNVVSASYALTSSHTPEALVTASLAGSNLTFTKGNNTQFSLTLPGGGGGNPITGSYTGSLLTNNIQSINFTGSGVLATVGGSNNITVNIPGGGSTPTGSFYVSSSISNATITFTQGDGTTEQVTVNNVASASFATSASFAPNFYNSDGTTTGVRLVTLPQQLKFANNGKFVISGSGDIILNGLTELNPGFVLTYDPEGGAPGVVTFASSSNLTVGSASFASTASFAPNIYNTNGTLSGDRVVTLGNNNELRFAPGTGTSEVRVSDGPSGGLISYEIVMSNTGEFRVDSTVSSSFFTNVFIEGSKVLTLEPINPLPSGVPTGSFAVSASIPPRPYMWDGSAWYAL